MQLKERLTHTVQSARGFTDALLQTFDGSNQWFFRVHPTANHAAWIVGHLGQVDDMLLTMIGSPHVKADPELTRLFSPGSQPSDNPSEYPPIDQLLAFYHDRRVKVMEALASMSDEELTKPVPPGSLPMFTDVASIFEMIAFHESMHAGQVTVIRQMLKHPRIIQFPKP